MPTPADKVRVIEQSLRCFAFGLLGLIPLLGLPFAVLAVFRHLNARSQVVSWRWDVELKNKQKVARVRPLFSFQAVAPEHQIR